MGGLVANGCRAELVGWVAKFWDGWLSWWDGWLSWLGWVAEFVGWVAELVGWVAKFWDGWLSWLGWRLSCWDGWLSIGSAPATAALWVRILSRHL